MFCACRGIFVQKYCTLSLSNEKLELELQVGCVCFVRLVVFGHEATTLREDVLRRSAFFAPSIGLISRGSAIYGVAPLSEMVSENDVLSELETQTPLTPDACKNLLSRTLILYDHTPKMVIKTLRAFDNGSCTPRLVCNSEDAEKIVSIDKHTRAKLLTRTSHFLVEDTLLLVYCGTLSGQKFDEIQEKLCSFPTLKASLIKEISSQTSGARFIKNSDRNRNNVFCVARYDPYEKSFFQRFIDAALYMEKGELLTPEERRLRTVLTILLFPTLFIPLLSLIIACGRKEKCKGSNLTRWQLSQYEKRQKDKTSLQSVVFSEEFDILPLKKIVFGTLQALKLKDRHNKTTDIGKKERLPHIFLGTAKNDHMTKMQFLSQIAFFAAMTLLFFGGLFSLIMYAMGNTESSLYSLLLSAAGASLALGTLLINKAKTESICAAAVTAVFVTGFWLGNAFVSRSTASMYSLGQAIALASILVSTIFAVAVCAENLILHIRKDRAIADKLDLSISSYLEVKSLLEQELEKSLNKNFSTHSCLDALKKGGCDISSFFEDTNSESSADLLRETELPCRISAV